MKLQSLQCQVGQLHQKYDKADNRPNLKLSADFLGTPALAGVFYECNYTCDVLLVISFCSVKLRVKAHLD